MRVYLDANFFIRFVEARDEIVTSFFREATAARIGLVTSELTLLEVLVGAIKRGDPRAVDAFERLLAPADSPIEIVAIDRSVLRRAAEGRVSHGNKTPDAIHVATAEVALCDVMATSDAGMKLPPSLRRCALLDLGTLL
jgi:predicted nucleic acid-binding protein